MRGEVTIPRELTVFEIGHDYILGAFEAGDGEPHLAMYRLTRKDQAANRPQLRRLRTSGLPFLGKALARYSSPRRRRTGPPSSVRTSMRAPASGARTRSP